MYLFIRNYPLSIVTCVIIWVLCFIDMPDTPLDNITLMDKWTHIAMYLGLCGIIWIECFRARVHMYSKKVWTFFWTCLVPWLMGGLIEILQANCTGGRRSGDWFDFFADSIGVALAQVICIPLARYLAKRHKD